MSYKSIPGVQYRYYSEADLEEEGHSDPSIEEDSAVLDELYFEKGKLWITVDTQENGYIHLEVPVTATDNWNNFFDSLPTWTQ
jgi:hypothetical protein